MSAQLRIANPNTRPAASPIYEEHGRWPCAWNSLMLKCLSPAAALVLQHAAGGTTFADAILSDCFQPRTIRESITDQKVVEQRIAALIATR